MQLNPYQDLPWEQLMPTARRKLLCSDKNYMFVLMECKAGTAQPPHSHPHTQVDYLLEGEIDMQVGAACQPAAPLVHSWRSHPAGIPQTAGRA